MYWHVLVHVGATEDLCRIGSNEETIPLRCNRGESNQNPNLFIGTEIPKRTLKVDYHPLSRSYW